MATLNEIAYNILNIARSGRSSDDDTLSINQIRHWVNYYRGTLLQKYTSNGRKIHPNCLQILVAPVVEAECDQGRIDQVPDVMSFAGQRAIERIETCDPNGWEFPSEITTSKAEELVIYVYYDTTSLDLPSVKQSYASVTDWINTQKYNLDNPQLGLEGHKIKKVYHTACTSERWVDWATTSFTGIFNNACASGGAGTGRCGGADMSVSGGSVAAGDVITQAGTETGNLGGYTGVASSSVTIDCTDNAQSEGGGIYDAVANNRNGYGKVTQIQDWVQNSVDYTLNPPQNTVANGYSGNTMYQEPPKAATYYNGETSYEFSTYGYNERIIMGSSTDDGAARVYENISNTWTLVGQGLVGATGEEFGYSTDISKIGDIIAVGARSTVNGGAGFVRVYKYDDDPMSGTAFTWVQMGSDITGQSANDEFGDSISLSKDGYRIAISAAGHDSDKGTVQVYEYDIVTLTWSQMGSDIDGSGTDSFGGHGNGNTIAFKGYDNFLSKWGSTLAIGSPDSTNGEVRIYTWNGSTWAQTGPTLTGQSSGDKFGTSVAFNEEATRLVVGAPINAGGGTARGEAYVYENISGVWTQMGSDIAGEANSDNFGASVDIDGEGETIIVGSPNNAGGGTNRGSARVYEWSGSAWSQKGADIDGEDNNDSAFAVSINDAGTIVALGSAANDDGSTNGGSVKIYRDYGGWSLIGNEINGIDGEEIGWGVSLANRAEEDRIVFYDTEGGTYATNGTTVSFPAGGNLSNGSGGSSNWKLSSNSEVWRRIGSQKVQGFGPPPAAGTGDNVVVLIFADEAGDAGQAVANEHGGPYHTNFRPGGNDVISSMWSAPTPTNPQGQPLVLDSTLNPNINPNKVSAGGTNLGAVSYTSTSLNVWRFATDNGNTEQSSHDISGYTSQNTSLTGAFSSSTISDVHPSACWKADWIHHIETIGSHQGLFKAFLYPTRRPNPVQQLQYNAPFALHAAGAISSGNQNSPDGTYTHDGTTGTVPYCQVVDLSPMYYINPYYTTGYGALDIYGWSLNYDMGEFNSEKLQSDLDEVLDNITWTEVVIPDNSLIDICDCYEHIPTNIDRLRFQQFNRFTPGRAINGHNIFRWYIEPQGFRYHDKISIILPDWNPDLGLAKIWAVFSNPEDIIGYHPDHEYPFPDELISPLMLEILQKELNMTLSTSTDQLNDSRGVAPTPQAKTKKK